MPCLSHEIPFRRLGHTLCVTQRLLGSWLALLTFLLLKTLSPLGKKVVWQWYPGGWERRLPQARACAQYSLKSTVQSDSQQAPTPGRARPAWPRLAAPPPHPGWLQALGWSPQ